MAPYIPPPAGQLDASTEEAIAAWTAALAAPDAWLESRLPTVDGLTAIAASQFPGVPSADLGRILAAAALALSSICGASKKAGVPLKPWDLAILLGLAGAKLVAAGGEIAAMQEGGEPVILRREVLAAEARRLIDEHDEWDSPHAIVTLHPEGERMRPGTWVCVMPDVDPRQYPALIARAAAEQQARMPGDPAYAYAFQGEFFGMQEPPPSASEAERERYERARVTRTFHEQPEAVEMAIAWVADIHGRSWYCSKTRGSEVAERFYAPGAGHGGAIVDALILAAATTGLAAWGVMPNGNPN